MHFTYDTKTIMKKDVNKMTSAPTSWAHTHTHIICVWTLFALRPQLTCTQTRSDAAALFSDCVYSDTEALLEVMQLNRLKSGVSCDQLETQTLEHLL